MVLILSNIKSGFLTFLSLLNTPLLIRRCPEVRTARREFPPPVAAFKVSNECSYFPPASNLSETLFSCLFINRHELKSRMMNMFDRAPPQYLPSALALCALVSTRARWLSVTAKWHVIAWWLVGSPGCTGQQFVGDKYL